MVEKKSMSDYLTAEEMKTMKPKKLRKKKDKKTGLRKTRQPTLDDDEGEDDFGSRRAQTENQGLDEEKEAKGAAFLAAKSKANLKISESIQRIDEKESGNYTEEVDSELSASLARVCMHIYFTHIAIKRHAFMCLLFCFLYIFMYYHLCV